MAKYPEYRVKFYKGSYKQRQLEANKDDAICYVEQHLNSTAKYIDSKPDYSMTIVSKNASKTSMSWGKWYATEVNAVFDEITRLGDGDGVKVGGRGGLNLKHTKMPAILLEPMFINDPAHSFLLFSDEGRDALAWVLYCSIVKFFPQGGLVAFSVGHKYKPKKDMGASRTFTMNVAIPNSWWRKLWRLPVRYKQEDTLIEEADIAEKILTKCANYFSTHN